jgi:short-subunit dehydrogenase
MPHRHLPLRPLDDQVVVITGASSGIGLVTARQAARDGARLVLAARNDEALETLAGELRATGTEVLPVHCDVGRQEDVARVAQLAVDRFGGFDTWVNNAGVSIFGRLVDVSLEDMHRVTDTVYWGVVHGSLAAVKHFAATRTEDDAGAVINVGSFFGDRSVPIQSSYMAAKHAVHGFTEGLRMETESDRMPVSVTLVHPGRIHTPYNDHAQSYLPDKPAHRGMVYPPEAVADAILHAAAHPTRDMFVGGQARVLALVGGLFPRLTDRIMEPYAYPSQTKGEPSQPREDSALWHAGDGLRERGTNAPHLMRSGSFYVQAEKALDLGKESVAETVRKPLRWIRSDARRSA